jgi:hypothetical protein
MLMPDRGSVACEVASILSSVADSCFSGGTNTEAWIARKFVKTRTGFYLGDAQQQTSRSRYLSLIVMAWAWRSIARYVVLMQMARPGRAMTGSSLTLTRLLLSAALVMAE